MLETPIRREVYDAGGEGVVEVHFGEAAYRDVDDHVAEDRVVGLQIVSVAAQECSRRVERRPLVSLLERMVARDSEQEDHA